MTHLNGESPTAQGVPQAAPAKVTVTVTLFASVGGALVAVVRDDAWEFPFSWECLGCEESSDFRFQRDGRAKESAQEHAAACRAVPTSLMDAVAPSAGDRLVAGELTATRVEIRKVAEAVRELGARITDGERILSEDITELRSELATEVGELCTEVAEARVAGVAELHDIAGALLVLVERLDRPRWWQWRRRSERKRAVGNAQATETAEGVSA